MQWIEKRRKLEAGETIQFRPQGNSMQPKISCGDLITIEPAKEPLQKGDKVFCKVHGNYYVHLIEAIKGKEGSFRYQIGNNKKHTNGTIGFNKIYGKVTKVEK